MAPLGVGWRLRACVDAKGGGCSKRSSRSGVNQRPAGRVASGRSLRGVRGVVLELRRAAGSRVCTGDLFGNTRSVDVSFRLINFQTRSAIKARGVGCTRGRHPRLRLSGPDHVSGIAVGGGRGADRRVQPCPTVMDVGLMRPACAIDAWCHAGRPRGGAARPSRHSRPRSAPREVSLSPPRGNQWEPTDQWSTWSQILKFYNILKSIIRF